MKKFILKSVFTASLVSLLTLASCGKDSVVDNPNNINGVENPSNPTTPQNPNNGGSNPTTPKPISGVHRDPNNPLGRFDLSIENLTVSEKSHSKSVQFTFKNSRNNFDEKYGMYKNNVNIVTLEDTSFEYYNHIVFFSKDPDIKNKRMEIGINTDFALYTKYPLHNSVQDANIEKLKEDLDVVIQGFNATWQKQIIAVLRNVTNKGFNPDSKYDLYDLSRAIGDVYINHIKNHPRTKDYYKNGIIVIPRYGFNPAPQGGDMVDFKNAIGIAEHSNPNWRWKSYSNNRYAKLLSELIKD